MADGIRNQGQIKVVVRILAGLAAQLTEDGDVTPIVGSGRALHKISVDDFLLDDDRPVRLLLFMMSEVERILLCSYFV